MGEAQTAAISDGRTTETTFEMNGTTFHRVAVTQDTHEGESSSDDGDAEDSWKAPRMQPLRNRAYKNPESAESQEARAREPPVVTVLPAFGEGRVFATMDAFFEEWLPHEKENFTKSTSRDSQTGATFNRNRENAHLEAGGVIDAAFLAGQMPVEMRLHHVTRRCHRGYRREPRPSTDPNKKKRTVKNSAFTDCPARIKVTIRQHADGSWDYVTSNEIHVHNHPCNPHTATSFASVADELEESGAMNEIITSIQAGARAKNVCDTIAARWGITLTPKQLANLKRDRLGGKSAVGNLKMLLERFSSFEGSHCLIVEDQEEEVCAIGVQSAFQREMFERYGDNLILDWTHNTNNLGFYLGSLMCTSVSGRGVSVFDFLCVEQTKVMMSTVISHFIKTNPSAPEKVRSFVIDKDYKEWAVLTELFPKASVLLCQFHVVSWFASVVTKKKYRIYGVLRDKVLQILYGMVYVRTAEAFDQLKERLEELLGEKSPTFLAYMTDRWYNCRHMWSNCERETVFTALNTTSNRIESSWNQLKKMLGTRLRIDLCLEAIFAYQTAVLRREYKLVNTHASRLALHTNADPYVRGTLAQLSDYGADEVNKQWESCKTHDVGMTRGYAAYRADSDSRVFAVAKQQADSSTYTVDSKEWRCSCGFHVSSALPCRHMFFVARRVLRLQQLPHELVARRWKMGDAVPLLSAMRVHTVEIQSLRTHLLLSDMAFTQLVGRAHGPADAEKKSFMARRNIAHFRLRRNEVSDVVVLNKLEKRNVVETEFAKLTSFMMAQGTPQFLILAVELRDILRVTLKKWRGEHAEPTPGDTTVLAPPPHALREDGPPAEPQDDAAEDIDEVMNAMLGNDGRDDAFDLQLRHNELMRQRVHAANDAQHARPTKDEDECKYDVADTPTNAVYEIGFPFLSPAPNFPVLPGPPQDHIGTIAPAAVDAAPSSPPAQVSQSPQPTPPSPFVVSQYMIDIADFQLDSGNCSSVQASGNDALNGPAGGESELAVLDDREAPGKTARAKGNNQLNELKELLGSECSSGGESDGGRAQLSTASSPPSSISTTGISQIMQGVAQYEMQHGQAASSGARGPLPTTTTKGSRVDRSRSLSRIKDIIHADSDTDVDDKVGEREDPRKRPREGITLLKMPAPLGAGAVKKLKTAGTSGKRVAPVMQTSSCPVTLARFVKALENTPNIAGIKELWDEYPVLFTERFLLKRVVQVDMMRIENRAYDVNFAVPAGLLTRLSSAIDAAVIDHGLVEGSISLVDEAASVSTQLVATIAGHTAARGFSATNVSAFASFQRVENLRVAYCSDVRWLRDDAEASLPVIPYAEATLRSRWVPTGQANDISLGARASVVAVLGSCTLRTRFSVRTARPDLRMEVAVCDVLGYLARAARLNDAVLMYALRQMANDQQGVHVFECLPCQSLPPPASILDARILLFPLNCDQAHWCLVCVKLVTGCLVHVGMYDPLQGVYDDSVQQYWRDICLPLITRWASRDGVVLAADHDTRVTRVQLKAQHDMVSCGIYCLAVAFDYVSETMYFQTIGELGVSAACQLRVRILWRILCDSDRRDDRLAEVESARIIQEFRNSKRTGPSTARVSKGMLFTT